MHGLECVPWWYALCAVVGMAQGMIWALTGLLRLLVAWCEIRDRGRLMGWWPWR